MICLPCFRKQDLNLKMRNQKIDFENKIIEFDDFMFDFIRTQCGYHESQTVIKLQKKFAEMFKKELGSDEN
jgi:uncharacterized protein YutD